MHLQESKGTMRFAEDFKTDTNSAGSTMFADQVKLASAEEKDIKNMNEVDVPISLEKSGVDALLDAYFASWILFLHRYQRDLVDHFSWTTSVSPGLCSLSADKVHFPSLHNVAGLLSAARDLRPNFQLTDLSASFPTFAFHDGIENEASIF